MTLMLKSTLMTCGLDRGVTTIGVSNSSIVNVPCVSFFGPLSSELDVLEFS